MRPLPVTGYVAAAITFMAVTILLWMALTHVELVIHAKGLVEPPSGVGVINHHAGGLMDEVLVTQGETVSQGQPLLAFDSGIAQTALDNVTRRWQDKAAEADRLRAEVMREDLVFTEGLAGERPDLVIQQLDLLEARRKRRGARRKALDEVITRRSLEVDALFAELGRLRHRQTIMGHQVRTFRRLNKPGFYPDLQLVAAERQLGDLASDVRNTQAHLALAELTYRDAKNARDHFERQWQSLALAELAEFETARDHLAETRREHETKLHNPVVLAPADGMIKDITVREAGQSVASNQPLMKLVSTGNGLVIRMKVRSDDIGHFRQGQLVKVRVVTRPLQGMLDGRVREIAIDSALSLEDRACGYDVVIETEEATPSGGGAGRNGALGMTIDADLLVRERTILAYLMDQLFGGANGGGQTAYCARGNAHRDRSMGDGSRRKLGKGGS